MKQRKMQSILLIGIMLVSVTMGIIPTLTADEPKTIYGTLYRDEGSSYEIAEDGIEVKIIIEGDTYSTTTVEWDDNNYILGIPQGCEEKIGYLYVDDDLIPIDNQSILIGLDNMYLVDLHVNISTQNFPPHIPFDPSPFDGASDVSINVDLSWKGGDLDGDPVTYDVYFGMSSLPSLMVHNQSGTSYNSGTMSYDTTYYWKIKAWDDSDASAAGLEWDFTTEEEPKYPPVVTGIPDQSIAKGNTFTTINLDDYISDADNTDDEMTWTYSGNTELTVSIAARIATITTPGTGWNGEETVNFRATDLGALFDEDNATFNVSSVNYPPNTPHDSDSDDDETYVDINTDLSWKETAIIWTTDIDGNEKTDFQPGENVYIHGSGFESESEIEINITRPGGIIESAPGGRFNDTLPFTNINGDFYYYNYDLNGIRGEYILKASDGTNSAVATFTDDIINPPLPAGGTCGLDIVLVLDSSGSIEVPNEMNEVKDAANAFVASLNSTPTTFSVVDFDTQIVSSLNFTDDRQAVYTAINSIGHQAGGGINELTNWHAALTQAHMNILSGGDPDIFNLVIIITDGDPTTWGYPTSQGSYGGTEPDDDDINYAIQAADSLKENGTRILAIGISNPTEDYLQDITNGSGSLINHGLTSDIITTDFEGLADELGDFADQLCNEPPVAVDDYIAVAEGGTATLLTNSDDSVLDNDTDADGDTLSASIIIDVIHGSLTLNSDGTFSYIHDGGETTSDSFTYKANDGTVDSNEATVYITISSVNDAPVVSDIPDQTIAEGGTFATISLDEYVSDVEDADSAISWSYTDDGDCDLGVEITDRVATITIPGIDWFGSEVITFIAEDTDSDTASDDATFEVSSVNDAPVLLGISDESMDENTVSTVVLSASDPDVEDSLVLSTSALPGFAVFTDNGDGSGSIVFSPGFDDSGSYPITVTATDDGVPVYDDVESFTLSVGNYNRKPNAPIDPSPIDEETKMSLTVTLRVNITDPDGDMLNVSFYDASDDSLIDIDFDVVSGDNASVVWSGLNYRSGYSWYAVANDSEYTNTSEIWSFTTKSRTGPGPSNVLPVADASLSDTIGFVGESLIFDGSRSKDFDGYIVNFTWDFDDGTQGYDKITTHIFNDSGIYQVVLTVFDDFGDTDTDIVNVAVLKGNHPPSTPTIDGTTSGHKNTSYEFSAVSFDPDNDTIQYFFDWGDGTTTTTEYLPNGTAVFLTYSWTNYGEYMITIQAFDNETVSGTVEHTIFIDVLPIDDIIKGYLVDEDSEDTYDVFDNFGTENQTEVEKENQTYLIDNDGDGIWDYAFNQNKGVSTYYQYLYDKYYEKFANDTPGFEILTLLAALALVFMVFRRKRRR